MEKVTKVARCRRSLVETCKYMVAVAGIDVHETLNVKEHRKKTIYMCQWDKDDCEYREEFTLIPDGPCINCIREVT